MLRSLAIIFRKISNRSLLENLRIVLRLVGGFFKFNLQREYIFEFPITTSVPVVLKNEIRIELLREYTDQLRRFGDRRGRWYAKQASDLFQNGNICFVAVLKNEVAGCLWTSFHEVWLSDIEYKLKVPDRIAPLIDGFTLEEYRGLGLYKILWNTCINYLVESKSYDKIYGFINHKNKRSLNVHDKLNLNKIIFDIMLIRVFGIRLHFKRKLS